MLQIEGIDFELPQMGREPKMGYADEFMEKTMISGKIRRVYKGKRFFATFSYAFLTEDQINSLNALLTTQRQKGFLDVIISSPFGNYTGECIIELGSDQTRFKYDADTGKYVWINWSLSLKGVNYGT